MSQHDNGRRAAGHQGEPWQQGRHAQAAYGHAQQDPSAGWHPGNQQGGHQGNQQGGHRDGGHAGGHQDQYQASRGQQGDHWRDPARAGGHRGASDDRQRGPSSGQGGRDRLDGQASDNDYGNRGITESGNFDNYAGGAQRQPGNQDHDGDGGYQGNRTQGNRGQSYHDADYQQWRDEHMRQLDRDYAQWRQHRYQRFSSDFGEWRNSRDRDAALSGSNDTGAPSGNDAGNAREASGSGPAPKSQPK